MKPLEGLADESEDEVVEVKSEPGSEEDDQKHL